MFCHHCFTIVLIGFSFYIGHTPVGCLVIILHNISDVPLQLGKLVNYKQVGQNQHSVHRTSASTCFRYT